jgi:uncharacterized membrane protein
MVDLGSLGLPDTTNISASGINDLGDIVGSVQSLNADGILQEQPYVWSPLHGSTILPAYHNEVQPSYYTEIASANALNSFGEIVGTSVRPNGGGPDALVWQIPVTHG